MKRWASMSNFYALNDDAFDFDDKQLAKVLDEAKPLGYKGRVAEAFGTVIRVTGVRARIGQQCLISDKDSDVEVIADVVGLSNGQAILLPLGNLHGITVDSEVTVLQEQSTVPCGQALLGRVISGLCEPLDGKPIPNTVEERPIYTEAPQPLTRRPIDDIFATGVRAIDSVLTTGVGQRMGIFAMAGGGKSTLLSMLAKQSESDVVVIALIGERGREVREFIENNLGDEGLSRAVMVVSTSDRPAVERVRAAYAATAIAEGFRAQGKNVLLLMDSVTRFARALREIGLSVGEPAVRRGYPPSVFAELPKLFERSGNDELGTMTAFYTVLIEDEDGNDPIAEEVRSILDGHIVLSRKLAQATHYPAIDVLNSTSRLFNLIASKEHQFAAAHLRKLLAEYEKVEFLIQVGEYQEGANLLADEAIAKRPKILQLLQQQTDESLSLSDTISQLLEVANART